MLRVVQVKHTHYTQDGLESWLKLLRQTNKTLITHFFWFRRWICAYTALYFHIKCTMTRHNSPVSQCPPLGHCRASFVACTQLCWTAVSRPCQTSAFPCCWSDPGAPGVSLCPSRRMLPLHYPGLSALLPGGGGRSVGSPSSVPRGPASASSPAGMPWCSADSHQPGSKGGNSKSQLSVLLTFGCAYIQHAFEKKLTFLVFLYWMPLSVWRISRYSGFCVFRSVTISVHLKKKQAVLQTHSTHPQSYLHYFYQFHIKEYKFKWVPTDAFIFME